MSAINQKEYLKKYLGIGKKSTDKKKKKKKLQPTGNNLRIIDDDIEATLNAEIQDDLNANNEDAPQIVAVIDERPPSLRINEKTNSKMWKPIGQVVADASGSKSTLTLGTAFKIKKEDVNSKHARERSLSPARKKEVIGDLYQNRKRKPCNDISPPRKSREDDNNSLPRKTFSDDNSPPRKHRHIDKDVSPPRRKKPTCGDLSPTRRKEDDNSPPRKHKHTEKDVSPPRRKKTTRSDLSPMRGKEDDISAYRKSWHPETNISPSRRSNKNDDMSPRRKYRDSSPGGSKRSNRKSRWETNPEETQKLEKTLDGKKAGLQNAKKLAAETALLKIKEDEMFKSMSAEVSGVGASTVVRRKKTDVDPEEEARKNKQEAEMREKYQQWGKGLKQVDDRNKKIEDELYEMSKPLARYADDEDLERHLKEREIEGDPMLAYIRKKKKKDAVDVGVPEKLTYMGEFMPNRFGIRPGYRWDGVDRSNGYEKKYFEVQNKKKASLEESYKWSTEDM